MDAPTALRYLSTLLLSIPLVSLLLLLLQLAVRAALSFVLLRTPEPAFEWSSLDPDPLQAPTHANSHPHLKSRHHQQQHQYSRLRVDVHRGDRGVECAVCLCNVEKGDEVRAIWCGHLFHKACLDGWVDHGWSTCPLCREALVRADEACRGAVDDAEEEEEEDGMSPSGLLYMVCLGGGGW